MQERHTNKQRYFNEQAQTTEKYVIPFIEEVHPIDSDTSILEIGCGEGGNLIPFVERGCEVVGIDILQGKIDKANQYFSNHPNKGRAKFMVKDIYNIDPNVEWKFDIIIMRDVIEHIHNQEKFMAYVKRFLKPTSKFFLGFPPWQMPFGGHQQTCKNSLLSKLPWFHLLPTGMYRSTLKLFGERQKNIENLIEIKETGISLERFRCLLSNEGYNMDREVWYFINPNYEVKFGLKPRKSVHPFKTIPFLRNFFITAGYYLISCPDVTVSNQGSSQR